MPFDLGYESDVSDATDPPQYSLHPPYRLERMTPVSFPHWTIVSAVHAVQPVRQSKTSSNRRDELVP
jgi:hypothetical protein